MTKCEFALQWFAEGYREFQERDLHHSHCVHYVEDAVNILEDIINY